MLMPIHVLEVVGATIGDAHIYTLGVSSLLSCLGDLHKFVKVRARLAHKF